MADIDLNDLHELHETILGGLTANTYEGLAGAILSGRRDEAIGLLAAYAVPEGLSREGASAYVDALLALALSGRPGPGDLDGPGVREDLTMQPCQSNVVEMALAGNTGSAALHAMVHEGYSGAGAKAAVEMIVHAEAGSPVDLHEVGLSDIAATGIDAGVAYVVRMGRSLAAGRFVDDAQGRMFEYAVNGRRVAFARVAQAWAVAPRA